MKTTSSKTQRHSILSKMIHGILLALFPMLLVAGETQSLLDDFSDEHNNSLGIPRMIIDDTTAGGKSTSTQSFKEGVLYSSGELTPPRGQPGWVSLISLLNPTGEGVDISQYEGVYLKIRIKEGMISLSVNGTDIVNYDYHAAMVAASGEETTEVKVPFSSMKRAWSEQTKLNTTSVASVSLVAVGLQPSSFAFEIDEIGFY